MCTKQCNDCGIVKTEDSFGYDKAGRRNTCKTCMRDRGLPTKLHTSNERDLEAEIRDLQNELAYTPEVKHSIPQGKSMVTVEPNIYYTRQNRYRPKFKGKFLGSFYTLVVARRAIQEARVEQIKQELGEAEAAYLALREKLVEEADQLVTEINKTRTEKLWYIAD